MRIPLIFKLSFDNLPYLVELLLRKVKLAVALRLSVNKGNRLSMRKG